MKYFALPPLISALLFIVLGLFVYSRNIKSPVNRSFFYVCFATFWWQASWFYLFLRDEELIANTLVRVGYTGIIFIPIALYQFIANFLRHDSDRIYIKLSYMGCFIFVFALWSSDFLISGYYDFFWGFYPKAGILHPLYLLLLSIIALRLVFLLRSSLTQRGPKSPKPNQIQYVFYALIAYIPASVDFLVNYGIEFYPFGFIAILITLGLISFAIVKHHLLDIQVIVRKTIIFAGLTSFIFGVFALVTFLIQEILSVYIPVGRTTITFVSVLFIVISYDRLRNLLIHITDNFLFQKKFDYQKLLRDASQGMSKIKSLDHLCKLVTHFITMRVRVQNAGVLARAIGTNQFILTYGRGYDEMPALRTIEASDPIIRYLERESEPLEIESVKERIEAKANARTPNDRHSKLNYDYESILTRMIALKASACVPSFLGRELRNVLILGEKKSGEYFTEEDLNVLYTLAQESAIAIENARLYDEAIQKSKELEGINKQLEVAQSNLISALNETELANKRLQDAQAQLIHEQKMATLGRLASSVGHEVNNPLTILSMNVSRAILKYRKNPNLKVNEILDVFQKMEQNIGRIKAVVNTLTGLLKKSEKGKFEPLSLKLVLEETLPLVQFQTYLDNLSGTDVEFDIPGNTPLIRGDLERLQEVFLNLFINAYHAMAGRRDRKIHVTATISKENTKQVLVEFSDNGCGMPDEVMKKIFQYGFTTKPVGKGSGMGLYMCRYIIELHGGDIRVRSKIGEGTTFMITLPIYEEETSIEPREVETKSTK